ncbi:MAG: site-specific DNA-methyltransferase [Epsilonproteobacteria bacterium]|nr:SAM-dependent methyltransferase [Campylobacterota bacterium]NPA57098.1 site-specific DNA-methyltransferase [Campylobacterota bacterium]
MGHKREGKGTETSTFGTSGRVSHNSTPFYSSNLYRGLPKEKKGVYRESEIPKENLNQIFWKSSQQMDELPDSSIHLVVTSPPYNVGKEYDGDLTLEEYRGLLREVWKEVYRVLVPGGRVCINVANLGRKPYIPLHCLIIEDMTKIGFLMRGEIIWNKGSSAGPSTAWGSWLSATNPTLRDLHEYILVFSKGSFKREKPEGRENTITREEFLEFTKSLWTFPTQSAKRIGHPAPFPVELPYRCIQLYTFQGEIVLDPFMGSGQTALAALKSKRFYIGYEIKREYVDLAQRRIGEYLNSPT